MHCTDPMRRRARRDDRSGRPARVRHVRETCAGWLTLLLVAGAGLGGCESRAVLQREPSRPPPATRPAAPRAPLPASLPSAPPRSPLDSVVSAAPGAVAELPVPRPGSPGNPGPQPGQDTAGPRRWAQPPPQRHRDWSSWRRDAAVRLVASNLADTYDGVPPEPLLAIPVLEVALRGDGQVADIRVLRHPSQARETVQRAMAAIRRGAPYARVDHLPRPWIWTETFLYADDGRFKPRTLD